MTLAHFDDFFQRFTLPVEDPGRESERSWWINVEDVRAKNYDLKAVNPNARDTGDQRTPEELFAIIEQSQQEIAAGLAQLRRGESGNT